MSPGFGWALAAGLVAAALFGVAAVVQAHAVRRKDERTRGAGALPAVLGPRPVDDGRGRGYLLGFVLHVVAIYGLPLYLAQATVAMSLPVTAVTAMLLHERLQPVHWWAVGLVPSAWCSSRWAPVIPGAIHLARVRRRAVGGCRGAARGGQGRRALAGAAVAALAGHRATPARPSRSRGRSSRWMPAGLAAAQSIGVYGSWASGSTRWRSTGPRCPRCPRRSSSSRRSCRP